MIITTEKLSSIERALGFKLYDNQKAYLLDGMYLAGGRHSGKTTAFCIKLALSEGPPLNLDRPEEFSDEQQLDDNKRYARSYFVHEFMKIMKTLSDFGFTVRDVRFENDDKPIGSSFRELIKRLKMMGYHIVEDKDYIRVILRCNSRYNACYYLRHEEVADDFILERIVGSINDRIINER